MLPYASRKRERSRGSRSTGVLRGMRYCSVRVGVGVGAAFSAGVLSAALSAAAL